MQPEAGDGTSARNRGARPERLGLGSRRVVWTSFGISLVVHLVAILAYPVFSDPVPSDPAAPSPETEESLSGLEVLRILEIASTPEPEEPDDPEEIEEIDEPIGVPTIIPIPSDVTGDLVAPGPTAAERLRVNLRNAILWGPLPAAITDLTLEQREELIVAGRLESWADSVAAALAAESALTDWTFTDDDGKRWGVSPGKLHLGDITLPLPFEFGTAVGKRDEVAQRQWQWDEIMRQGARMEVQEAWKERQQAIRERRDRERASTRPDTIRGGR